MSVLVTPLHLRGDDEDTSEDTFEVAVLDSKGKLVPLCEDDEVLENRTREQVSALMREVEANGVKRLRCCLKRRGR